MNMSMLELQQAMFRTDRENNEKIRALTQRVTDLEATIKTLTDLIQQNAIAIQQVSFRMDAQQGNLFRES